MSEDLQRQLGRARFLRNHDLHSAHRFCFISIGLRAAGCMTSFLLYFISKGNGTMPLASLQECLARPASDSTCSTAALHQESSSIHVAIRVADQEEASLRKAF